MTETTGSDDAAFAQWEVDVDLIDANPQQPRDNFDEDRLAELAASVTDFGVIQPILVRHGEPGRFELIAGERRLRAARSAGLATVPAVLRDTSDRDLLPLAVLENLHREALNPLELAAAYAQMLAEGDLTHAHLAAALHIDRTQVGRTLSLLKLPPRVQRRVAAGVLSASHAEALAGLGDPHVAELLADRIIAEGLSVRTVREMIALGGLPGAESYDGRGAARTRRRGPKAPVSEEIRQAAVNLGDLLDTRVRVLAGKNRGRIVVDFADRDDLERILSALTAPATPR